MSTPYKVGVFVGSLRKASYNRMAANALIKMAPASLKGEIIEIGDLPFYNEDLDTASPPQPWVAFREKVKAVDAVLFCTPEYNRSFTAVLKNALDVGSRPYGKSVWPKKPGAIVSVSPGAIGGFGANHALRQSFVFLDVPLLQQPEMYIGGAGNVFDKEGNIVKDDSRAHLQKFIDAYAAWVALILGKR